MLMKDKTHSRLNGVGIYSLHTTFYAKIITIKQGSSHTSNPDVTSPTFSIHS